MILDVAPRLAGQNTIHCSARYSESSPKLRLRHAASSVGRPNRSHFDFVQDGTRRAGSAYCPNPFRTRHLWPEHFPVRRRGYHADRRLRHPKLRGNIGLCTRAGCEDGPNRDYLLARKNTPSMRVALRGVWVAIATSMSFLEHAVESIVAVCPDEQVLRVHARWCVARVAHNGPSRDLPKVHFPCVTVGTARPSCDAKYAVAVGVLSAVPYPAAGRILDDESFKSRHVGRVRKVHYGWIKHYLGAVVNYRVDDAYNGGGDPTYPDRILNHVRALKEDKVFG